MGNKEKIPAIFPLGKDWYESGPAYPSTETDLDWKDRKKNTIHSHTGAGVPEFDADKKRWYWHCMECGRNYIRKF